MPTSWKKLSETIKSTPDIIPLAGTITSKFSLRTTSQATLTITNFTSDRGVPGFTFDLEKDPDATAPLSMVVGTVITPYDKTDEGQLVHAASVIPWRAIIEAIERDPACIKEIGSYKWEELIAAAFDDADFDEIILTPKSGDKGRDVIAIKSGVGSLRILGSVKAFKPGHLVPHDDVRALMGVLASDRAASKGMLLTTSDFAPGVHTDDLIKPHLPHRIELMNGKQMLAWFRTLSGKGN